MGLFKALEIQPSFSLSSAQFQSDGLNHLLSSLLVTLILATVGGIFAKVIHYSGSESGFNYSAWIRSFVFVNSGAYRIYKWLMRWDRYRDPRWTRQVNYLRPRRLLIPLLAHFLCFAISFGFIALSLPRSRLLSACGNGDFSLMFDTSVEYQSLVTATAACNSIPLRTDNGNILSSASYCRKLTCKERSFDYDRNQLHVAVARNPSAGLISTSVGSGSHDYGNYYSVEWKSSQSSASLRDSLRSNVDNLDLETLFGISITAVERTSPDCTKTRRRQEEGSSDGEWEVWGVVFVNCTLNLTTLSNTMESHVHSALVLKPVENVETRIKVRHDQYSKSAECPFLVVVSRPSLGIIPLTFVSLVLLLINLGLSIILTNRNNLDAVFHLVKESLGQDCTSNPLEENPVCKGAENLPLKLWICDDGSRHVGFIDRGCTPVQSFPEQTVVSVCQKAAPYNFDSKDILARRIQMQGSVPLPSGTSTITGESESASAGTRSRPYSPFVPAKRFTGITRGDGSSASGTNTGESESASAGTRSRPCSPIVPAKRFTGITRGDDSSASGTNREVSTDQVDSPRKGRSFIPISPIHQTSTNHVAAPSPCGPPENPFETSLTRLIHTLAEEQDLELSRADINVFSRLLGCEDFKYNDCFAQWRSSGLCVEVPKGTKLPPASEEAVVFKYGPRQRTVQFVPEKLTPVGFSVLSWILVPGEITKAPFVNVMRLVTFNNCLVTLMSKITRYGPRKYVVVPMGWLAVLEVPDSFLKEHGEYLDMAAFLGGSKKQASQILSRSRSWRYKPSNGMCFPRRSQARKRLPDLYLNENYRLVLEVEPVRKFEFAGASANVNAAMLGFGTQVQRSVDHQESRKRKAASHMVIFQSLSHFVRHHLHGCTECTLLRRVEWFKKLLSEKCVFPKGENIGFLKAFTGRCYRDPRACVFPDEDCRVGNNVLVDYYSAKQVVNQEGNSSYVFIDNIWRDCEDDKASAEIPQEIYKLRCKASGLDIWSVEGSFEKTPLPDNAVRLERDMG